MASSSNATSRWRSVPVRRWRCNAKPFIVHIPSAAPTVGTIRFVDAESKVARRSMILLWMDSVVFDFIPAAGRVDVFLWSTSPQVTGNSPMNIGMRDRQFEKLRWVEFSDMMIIPHNDGYERERDTAASLRGSGNRV
jgi:hypothetical protein